MSPFIKPKWSVAEFKLWLSWKLARLVSWLRGERWYVADTWHGVPGNRASELRQQIWLDVVVLGLANQDDSDDTVQNIGEKLNELEQLAGSSWGHVWPKEEAIKP